MTDPLAPKLAKTDAPAPVPAGPAKTTAPAPAPRKAEATEGEDDKAEDPVAAPAKRSPWLIVLGALSAVLLIMVVVSGSKTTALKTSVTEYQNRAAQYASASALMQTQLDTAKADTVRLQALLGEAKGKSELLGGQVDKNGFQSQMEDAKVASIRHQGEVEIAQAQATVSQTQMNDAKADTARLQGLLDKSRASSADLQTRLTKAEADIAALQKTRPKG